MNESQEQEASPVNVVIPVNPLGGVPRRNAITFVIAQRAYVSVLVLAWAAISVLLSLTVKEQQHV